MRCLAHNNCRWPTQWTVTKLWLNCAYHESLATMWTGSSSSSTPIARAKLKQSQLFEHDSIYGIDDTLQNRSCPMNYNKRAISLWNDVRGINIYWSWGMSTDKCGACSGLPQQREIIPPRLTQSLCGTDLQTVKVGMGTTSHVIFTMNM